MTDHFEVCADPSAADWIAESDTPFDQLVTFGPDVFEASARLRFIPDPISVDQDEADVIVSDDHLRDLDQVRMALRQLEPFTSTADECFFCIWDGYSDVVIPPRIAKTSMVVLPHRQYVLAHAPLSSIDWFLHDFGRPGSTSVAPPAFVWPADHAWLLVSDVDPHWAGISSRAETIDALVHGDVLDIVTADPRSRQPSYY